MGKKCLFTTVILFLSVIPCLSQKSQTQTVFAFVEADSGKTRIKVEDLKLEIKYGGYGVYVISDYPVLTQIPLENGESVQFGSIISATFQGKRVEWKKYIERENRDDFNNIDEMGFYHWEDTEVECTIKDKQDRIVRSRIKHPHLADIYLTGITDRGSYNLQLDLENGKTVHVIFVPDFVMQCEKDAGHVFPNSEWNYCPNCGGKLRRINTVRK